MDEDKINKEKNNSVKEEIIKCVDFKNKVLKFTSSSKEGEKNNEKEKEKEKISPKSLTNIDNLIKEMNENNNAKYNKIPKEIKEIKKINGDEKLK